MTYTDSHYYRQIRMYCVNVTRDYCKIKGEPIALSEGVKLVKQAISREHLIQVPHEDLTIRRRFNEAQTKDFDNQLVWLGQKTINGLADSWYIINPLLADADTKAKLQKWLPTRPLQAQLF